MNVAAPSERTSEFATLLEVQGLAKAYGKTWALRDCNLKIRQGRVHAVIGENGSGKSTLVKILAGVVQPDKGKILTSEGAVVNLASPQVARRHGIAVTFQEVLVLDDLSLLDNLWLGQDGLLRHHIDRSRRIGEADATLADLLGEARPDMRARTSSLNLGVRQAAVIARSLLLRPRLLILDEATAALDISVRDRLFALLRRMVGEGLAVLFITHKMDEIALLSDEVTVLRSGESVANLPIAEASSA